MNLRCRMASTKLLLAVLLLSFIVSDQPPAALATDAKPAPPASWPLPIAAQHRPGTYLWCPGSAMDEKSIDFNLAAMHQAGIGTAHLVPIYGAKGYEDRYIEYLSPKWVQMFGHMLTKAEELGMQVDMTTGTGWCFGGPDLPDNFKDTQVQWRGPGKPLGLAHRRKVKRAAPGGEGAMLNPYSPAAMRHYLQRFSKAIEPLGDRRPRAQYHDSFEYGANWSADLPEQFRKRRGYDLQPHLETFFGKTSATNRDKKARLKYDYRQTLAELHRDTMAVWVDWARQRGMVTRDQAHGAPANLLDIYALADIPETEMFGAPRFAIPGFARNPKWCRNGDNNRQIMQMASSAAHVAHKPGRQLVAAESFTWLRNHWHTTLGQMKLSADLFFLAGVNHLIYHGMCYSPTDAPWPGWFFYASTKADWRNSTWRDISLLNAYIARCQSVLQAGRPANDVLIYWPIHDLWMEPDGLQKNLTVHHPSWMVFQPIGKLAARLQKKGYTCDFISDRMLDDLRVEHGRVEAPGGTYRAILVPACTYMPAKTAQRLAELAEAGTPVLFEAALPEDAPGLDDLATRRQTLAKAKARLKKVAHIATPAETALAKIGIRRETMVDAGLEFIRREIDGETWYFIANHSASAIDRWLAPALAFKAATAYDPMTGRSGVLAVRNEKGQTRVRLQLQPGESLIVRVGNGVRTAKAQPWRYLHPAGDPITLAGTWRIEFIAGGPKLPKSYATEALSSWTDAPDPAAKAFAGTARYTLAVNRPAAEADDWLLELGDVRHSARVRVNGRPAGAVFALPFRLRIGHLLKPGANMLEIDVTSLAANRIRAIDRNGSNWKVMRDINIVNQNYKPFDAKDWPIEPCGLLGPVRMRPMSFRPQQQGDK